MDTSIRVCTTVLAGRRIEVNTPDLAEGSSVDVLVLPHDNVAHSIVSRQDILRMPVEQRRQLLLKQSGQLLSHYEGEPDRSEWQGGDILE